MNESMAIYIARIPPQDWIFWFAIAIAFLAVTTRLMGSDKVDGYRITPRPSQTPAEIERNIRDSAPAADTRANPSGED
jgi:hypothetical protein